MSFTLAEVQAQLTAYKAASIAVAEGQSYSINGRTLTRGNMTEIRNAINSFLAMESQLLRRAAGQSELSVKLAKFTRG